MASLTVSRTPKPNQPTVVSARQNEDRKAHADTITDEELIHFCLSGKIPTHALEKLLCKEHLLNSEDPYLRAVRIRRSVLSRSTSAFSNLEGSNFPYMSYDYREIHGACCENVIGYIPIPVGVAGPIRVDDKDYFVPMATTEGALIASTTRGSKAIALSQGATTVLVDDGMTRSPCVSFPTLARAASVKSWIESRDGRRMITEVFNATSQFTRLQKVTVSLAGSSLYVRLKATTGDAMGMNMVSKGCQRTLHFLKTMFPDMTIVSLSGNMCTDKKSAAINWIEGRGKSVAAEAFIPGHVVREVLKSDVDSLVALNTGKNLVGSAMAGSIGGFNAQASNIVSAIFLATGQDPAQVVESSSCITTMSNKDGYLQISVTMPSLEVGTVGGGTTLEAQATMLEMLGVKGPHATSPGSNACQLSRIIVATVLAGEVSLCAALAAGHLVEAHMTHNRRTAIAR